MSSSAGGAVAVFSLFSLALFENAGFQEWWQWLGKPFVSNATADSNTAWSAGNKTTSFICLLILSETHCVLFQSRDGNLWRDKFALINLCKDPLFSFIVQQKNEVLTERGSVYFQKLR